MKSYRTLVCLSTIILVAFALRTYRLDFQSLWYDEAFSVELAGQGLDTVTQLLSTVENHPPLHFFALHFWERLTGESEFAVRYLSLVMALPAVSLIYVLGRRLLGMPASLVAALLLAFSPPHVYYSQEARMYSLLVTLILLSAYALLRALQGGGILAWSGFAFAGLLAIYSHYYAALALVAEGTLALIWIALGWYGVGRSDSPARATGGAARELGSRLGWSSHAGQLHVLGAGVAVAVGFLPWAAVPLSQFGAVKNFYEGQMDLLRVAGEIVEMFATGRTGRFEGVSVAAWGLLGLGIVGWVLCADTAACLTPKRRSPLARSYHAVSRWQMRLFLGIYFLLPIALAFLLLTQKPKFSAQYLLLVLPALILLLASALVAPLRLGHRVGGILSGLLMLGVLAVSTTFLGSYYFDPSYARDDWREAARYVAQGRQGGDAIVLISGYAAPAFRYYYQAPDWLPVPERPTMRMDEVIGYDDLGGLRDNLAGARRVWLVLWQDEVADPNKLVAGALARVTGAISSMRFGHIVVDRYDLLEGAALAVNPLPQVPLDLNFGDEVRLLGYDLKTPAVRPGEVVDLDLYWKAIAPLEEDYHVALRLLDRNGREWGKVMKRPASYLFYTKRWKVDSTVSGEMSLPVMHGTPPGEYDLYTRVFPITTMKGLDVLRGGVPVGSDALIGRVRIEPATKPPSYADLGLATPRQESAGGGVVLLGAMLSNSEAPAGGNLEVTTLWEAANSPRGDLKLQTRLVDAQGVEVARQMGRPVGEDYPTDKWRDGERLRGRQRIAIPSQAQGIVRVLGRLLEAGTGSPAGNELPLVEASILGREHNTTRPPSPREVQRAWLGESIRFLGYELDSGATLKPGQRMGLRLHWQALISPQKSYKVFTHLIDEQERIWAQSDAIPGGGALPTSSWIAGEFVGDEYLLDIKPNAVPGEYLVEIGMYDELTGQRLPVVDESGALLGDRVVLKDRIRLVGR